MVFLLFGVFLGGVLGRFVGFGVRFRLCFAGFWGVCWGCRGVLVGLGVFLVVSARFWGFFAWLGLGFRFPGGFWGQVC